MVKRSITIFLSLILCTLYTEQLCAQETALFTCFNAQEIHFPINQNDFTGSRLRVDTKEVNALFYLYEDKYTFWYKFIAHEAMTIDFSVAPGNPDDRYKAVAFQYKGDDFCERLIIDRITPMNLNPEPIFYDNEVQTIIYKNTIDVVAGDTIYVSVLSLNDRDCGHFLYIEAKDESLSMHAIHAPCYDFAFLESPDFKVPKMSADDIPLKIDLKKVLPETLIKEPTSEFKSLKTIEIQSKDDDFISVGDKLVLNKVFFYNNTYALKPGAEEELFQLLNFLNDNADLRIEIQGHTANDTELITPDPNFKGQGKEWNFKGSSFELSEKRADAVRNFLIENGVLKKRLVAKGYGNTQKRFEDAQTFEDYEQNMRVEILIIE